MDDLIVFLRARLDEDEAVALKVKATWRLDGPDTGVIIASVGRNAEQCAEAYWVGIGEHIALHDPARVLREVAAKRRIIGRHQPRSLDRWVMCSNCRPVDPDYPSDLTSVVWPCPDLRDLAAPFADHPDYLQEWKP